jgi:hypothetical protein
VALILQFITVFLHSDLEAGFMPDWYIWGAITGTHILFGVIIAACPKRIGVAIALAWVAKELAFDIPNGGGAVWVGMDSLADLEAGALGYVLARWRLWVVASQFQPGHISQAVDPSDAPRKSSGGNDART